MRNALIVALLAAAPAFAAPEAKVNAQAAGKFRKDLRAAIDQGTGPLGNQQQRRAHASRLAELEGRAGQLFGDVFNPTFGPCVKAASLSKSAYDERLAADARPTPINLAGIARFSFEAGVEYWACRTAVDALSPAK